MRLTLNSDEILRGILPKELRNGPEAPKVRLFTLRLRKTILERELGNAEKKRMFYRSRAYNLASGGMYKTREVYFALELAEMWENVCELVEGRLVRVSREIYELEKITNPESTVSSSVARS